MMRNDTGKLQHLLSTFMIARTFLWQFFSESATLRNRVVTNSHNHALGVGTCIVCYKWENSAINKDSLRSGEKKPVDF